MSEDVLIYVDNVAGNNSNDGTQRRPVATADEAFSRLPSSWRGRAEITFAPNAIAYPITSGTVYLGTPTGPDASSLVLRGGYRDTYPITASGGTEDYLDTAPGFLLTDDALIGKVLMRLRGTGSPIGTAISIRGSANNPDGTFRIFLQSSIGPIVAENTFVVQQAAVTLVPKETLNLISQDGRSPNLKLIGIRIAPAPGKGLTLLNVRALCDTCEIFFRRDLPAPPARPTPVIAFVHTNSRIQGGIEEDPQRAQAGVHIHGDDRSNIIWATRGGVLGGHLTFSEISVRASQGGVFVPKSLEARNAAVRIMAGGTALAEPRRERGVVVGGWGTASNKARIRSVRAITDDAADGLRMSSGASLHSPEAPIHLDVYGCERDGIRVEGGSIAVFGPPITRDAGGREVGGEAGLVTSRGDNLNSGFGLNVRNGSRVYVGRDAVGVTPLKGYLGDVTLDGFATGDAMSWSDVREGSPAPNNNLSLVRLLPHEVP